MKDPATMTQAEIRAELLQHRATLGAISARMKREEAARLAHEEAKRRGIFPTDCDGVAR